MLMPHRRQGCGGTRQGDHWRRRQRVVRDLYHKQGSPGSHAQHPCRRGNEVIESCSDNVVAQVKEDVARAERTLEHTAPPDLFLAHRINARAAGATR